MESIECWIQQARRGRSPLIACVATPRCAPTGTVGTARQRAVQLRADEQVFKKAGQTTRREVPLRIPSSKEVTQGGCAIAAANTKALELRKAVLPSTLNAQPSAFVPFAFDVYGPQCPVTTALHRDCWKASLNRFGM